MPASRSVLLILCLWTAACGDKDDTDADTGAGTSDDTGEVDTTSDDTGGDTSGEPCAEPFAFTDPGAGDYLQWAIDGREYTSLPPAGGQYLYNTWLSVALYTADFSGSLGFGAGPLPDGLAAGTYSCASDGMMVNGGPLGQASSQYPGSACSITFTEDITDGGRIVGSFWAQLSDFHGNPSACVLARFSLTDAP